MRTPDFLRTGIHRTQDFSALVGESRSPFFGATSEGMFDLFISQLQCDLITIANTADSPEGYLLFRQFKPVDEIYIVLSGSIVFFADEVLTERPERMPLTTGVLTKTKYFGTLGPGQVAGILEALIQHFLPNSAMGDNRRILLSQSSLAAANGRWLLSGYVTPKSQILCITLTQFFRLLTEPWLLGLVFRSGQASMSLFEKFCCEELVFRQAQYLHSQVLVQRGQRTALLAAEFYEYYRRNAEDVQTRFFQKGYMSQVRVEQLSWLLGLPPTGAKKHVDELIELGLLERYTGGAPPTKAHARSSRFNYDVTAMKDYYVLASDNRHEAIKQALGKKYAGGYNLRPLDPSGEGMV